MSRTRLLKPGFFRNERLCELSHTTRLLFAGLWGLADREGRLEDRPKRIAADVFPYEPALDVEAMLDALAAAGFLVRYAVADAHYIAIPTFGAHQNPHLREAPSTIPAPTQAVPRLVPAPAQAVPSTSPAPAQAPPRSPVSVSNTVPITESGTGSGAVSVSESEQVPRAARAPAKPADKGKLTALARQVLREHPNETQETLIDTLQWTAQERFKIAIKRQEAITYLQAGS